MVAEMQGLETDAFSSVVSDIYDCALNPANYGDGVDGALSGI
jgi:hypothetical protein